VRALSAKQRNFCHIIYKAVNACNKEVDARAARSFVRVRRYRDWNFDPKKAVSLLVQVFVAACYQIRQGQSRSRKCDVRLCMQ
jgi:hypothetical protein